MHTWWCQLGTLGSGLGEDYPTIRRADLPANRVSLEDSANSVLSHSI